MMNAERWCLWLVFLASCGVIALGAAARFAGNLVWDDSFMFVRYADNVLRGMGIAWNPGGEPTYGLTSLGTLAAFLPIRMLVPGNAPLALWVLSCLGGAAFVALTAALVGAFADAGAQGRRVVMVLVVFMLALGSGHLTLHFSSGMDTTVAMAYLSLYILLAKWQERGPGLGKAVAAGACGGLMYLVRPDLMLYSAAVPVAMFLLAPDASRRRQAFVMGGVTLLVLAAQLAWAHWYFGSAVPLPFYAKAMNLYGAGPWVVLRETPRRELARFVVEHWVVFVLVVAGSVLAWRSRRQGGSAVDWALLVATVLFIVYHFNLTLQVMGLAARFYYPTFPALVFLAAQGMTRVLRATGGGEWTGVSSSNQPQGGCGNSTPASLGLWRGLPRSAYWLATLLALFALTPPAKSSAQAVQTLRKQGAFGCFDLRDDCDRNWNVYWPRLVEFAALPDDLVIALDSVGRPGVLAPDKRLIDTVGLNERALATERFSAERFFQRFQPDLLYMPYYFYRDILAELHASPFFREHYELFPAQELRERTGVPALFGVALLRDSPHYLAMRRILLSPWTPPPGRALRTPALTCTSHRQPVRNAVTCYSLAMPSRCRSSADIRPGG